MTWLVSLVDELQARWCATKHPSNHNQQKQPTRLHSLTGVKVSFKSAFWAKLRPLPAVLLLGLALLVCQAFSQHITGYLFAPDRFSPAVAAAATSLDPGHWPPPAPKVSWRLRKDGNNNWKASSVFARLATLPTLLWYLETRREWLPHPEFLSNVVIHCHNFT